LNTAVENQHHPRAVPADAYRRTRPRPGRRAHPGTVPPTL